jgi:hypothetical protein
MLSDIKLVLKQDAGLDINNKTKILVRGITAAEAHAAAQPLLAADLSLAHLGPLLTPEAFADNCYIGLGVPIGTDAFIQHFVAKKCQEIMEDVDKLDNIQDCFIHYQLLRFCQATRLQYLNRQVQLVNQQVLQQQHVDHKIANALLNSRAARRVLGGGSRPVSGPASAVAVAEAALPTPLGPRPCAGRRGQSDSTGEGPKSRTGVPFLT